MEVDFGHAFSTMCPSLFCIGHFLLPLHDLSDFPYHSAGHHNLLPAWGWGELSEKFAVWPSIYL